MRAVFKTVIIDDRTRELLVLRTAKAVECDYGLRAGRVLAANTGLTAGEIAAATGDAHDGWLRPEQVLLCAVADELSTSGTLSDATLGALLRTHDVQKCRMLVLVVCWFNLVNRFENGCRVPLEPTSTLASLTSPE